MPVANSPSASGASRDGRASRLPTKAQANGVRCAATPMTSTGAAGPSSRRWPNAWATTSPVPARRRYGPESPGPRTPATAEPVPVGPAMARDRGSRPTGQRCCRPLAAGRCLACRATRRPAAGGAAAAQSAASESGRSAHPLQERVAIRRACANPMAFAPGSSSAMRCLVPSGHCGPACRARSGAAPSTTRSKTEG